jgi:hypothetical protein
MQWQAFVAGLQTLLRVEIAARVELERREARMLTRPAR